MCFISIKYFNISNITLVIIAIAPVLGHAYSPFLKFHGGKAIAATFGTFLALYPMSYVALTFALILMDYCF